MSHSKELLLERLRTFRNAAMELSDAWNDVIDEDPSEDPLTEAYPFAKDFEEIILNIQTWEAKAKESLRTG